MERLQPVCENMKPSFFRGAINPSHRNLFIPCGFIQDKFIFSKRNEPFRLHFRKFIGHGAAVDGEVIGKLLPTKGDGKVRASVFQGLLGKIRQEPFP